eukprot:9044137-Pyramimonas_sp.AAC.1
MARTGAEVASSEPRPGRAASAGATRMGLSARMPGWPGRCPLHAWGMRSSRLLVSRGLRGVS